MVKMNKSKTATGLMIVVVALLVAVYWKSNSSIPRQKVIDTKAAAKLLMACKVSDVTFQVHTGYTELALKNGDVKEVPTSPTNDAAIRQALNVAAPNCDPDPQTGIE